jgi:hypothetical protein
MPCKCGVGFNRWRAGLKEITQGTAGIEKINCLVLYVLRLVSISEWISFCITGGRKDDASHETDRRIIDYYVFLKTFLVGLLFFIVPNWLPWWFEFFGWYLLAEMYVSLLNVVFVGTLKRDRGIRIGRSLLLLMFNASQLVLSFALFYRVHADLTWTTAFKNSIHVFSTLRLPEQAPKLETAQIVLNFVFIAILLARFLGMPSSDTTSEKNSEQPNHLRSKKKRRASRSGAS